MMSEQNDFASFGAPESAEAISGEQMLGRRRL